jgi:hypothetical protein
MLFHVAQHEPALLGLHVSTLKAGEIHMGLDKCNPGSLLVFLEFVEIDVFNLVTVYNVSSSIMMLSSDIGVAIFLG